MIFSKVLKRISESASYAFSDVTMFAGELFNEYSPEEYDDNG